MKKPWLAFLLNFLVAGLGIIYLGLWNWGFTNFAITVALGLVLNRFAPSTMSMAAVVIPIVNGSIAMNVAKAMNDKKKLAAPPPAPTPSSPVA